MPNRNRLQIVGVAASVLCLAVALFAGTGNTAGYQVCSPYPCTYVLPTGGTTGAFCGHLGNAKEGCYCTLKPGSDYGQISPACQY